MPGWRGVADAQAGLISRAQLSELGITAARVRAQVDSERWVLRSPQVVSTTTGALTREQTMWLGVLHVGRGALVGGLSAAEVHGLAGWHRDDITVLVPPNLDARMTVPGVRLVRTRRALDDLRSRRGRLPVAQLEPAILLFAAYERSRRTAEGVLAAAVQQQLTDPATLLSWIERMRPLRRAKHFQGVLAEIAGGAQSVAELDVRRMCRAHRLAPPARQTKRRDSEGRLRFTDCEWPLPDGRVLVLEVDGAFHMDVEHWEDDISRQRRLSSPDRTIVRCTSRELRDEPERVARDLELLGVPRAA